MLICTALLLTAKINPPLLNLPRDRIIPCIMHALMRITDRLEHAIIKEVLECTELLR